MKQPRRTRYHLPHYGKPTLERVASLLVGWGWRCEVQGSSLLTDAPRARLLQAGNMALGLGSSGY